VRRRVAAAGLLFALTASVAVAADEDSPSSFRYIRALEAPGSGPVRFEPDRLLYAHAKADLSDLRIFDSQLQPVPWRRLPPAPREPERPVLVLNSGRQGSATSALVDLGPRSGVHDRLELEIPARGFVGRVEVSGSDDRKTFTRLSRTLVYDLAGARRAHSTVVVYPESDFRYLSLRATGVPPIRGATVSSRAARPSLLRRPLRRLTRTEESRETVLLVDLGFGKIPVDELALSAASGTYDRSLEIEGSNDGTTFAALTSARIFRFLGARSAPIPLPARHRYLRITIANGDDEPLGPVEVAPFARLRTLLTAPTSERPLRLFYGNPLARAPRYELARFPRRALRLQLARVGTLGPEQRNSAFEPPADTRSFARRHPAALQAALAVAALAITLGGFLALRRRT